MKVWEFIKGEKEKILADRMRDLLMRELPPDSLKQTGSFVSVNRVTRALEKTVELAKLHQQQNALGMISRARLANNFKWALTYNNYPEEFVELATESLIMELAKIAHKLKD